MAIEFEELEGSPRIVIGPDATTARREFRIAWSDWQAFASQVVGGWKNTGRTFRRIAPLEFPGFPEVHIHELTIQPFDQFAPSGEQIESIRRGTNSYPMGGARVIAEYLSVKHPDTGLEPTIADGTYLTYEIAESQEIMATPSSAWVWTDDDTTVPDTVNADLHLPLANLRIGWHFVPLPPWATIRALRGRVNDVEFYGAPAGSVLFLGARVKQKFGFLAGPSIFSLEYRFAERSQLWNSYLKPGFGFTEVSLGASGPSPHPTGDFHALFAFGPP